MRKSKSEYLLKNIGLLIISNFSTKILTFFLVPLYTNILSTAEYGSYDLVSTTVNLLVPIVTVDIIDASLRFSMEPEVSKSGVFTVSIKYYLIGAVLTSVFVAANYFFNISETLAVNSMYLIFLYLSMSLGNLLAAFARGAGNVKVSSISGTVSSFVTIICNIIFLIPLHLGIKGYFWAMIIGSLTQSVCIAVVMNLKKYIDLHHEYKDLELEMVSFSRPLVVNNIAWWINNASDRYVVTYFCGIEQNGIYSVGYKIPTILSVFQSIFQQAWLLSAVKDFDSEDKGGFFSRTYSIYNFGMIIICSLLIWVDKFLAKILYAKDFYSAWKFVPFLTFGFVFVAMANYMGGVFQAVKKPRIIAYSTFGGALLNVVLNIILTRHIGAIGAAIATCFSYFMVWQIRFLIVGKYIKLEISVLRDYVVYALIFLQIICCLILEGIMDYVVQTFILTIVFLLNKKEFIEIKDRIVGEYKRRIS